MSKIISILKALAEAIPMVVDAVKWTAKAARNYLRSRKRKEVDEAQTPDDYTDLIK